MTWTLQPVSLLREVHSAGQVRTFLAVCHECVRRRSDEDAGVLSSRIIKQFDLTNLEVADSCDPLRCGGRLNGKPASHHNPEIPDKHSQAGQNQEFGKLTARNITLCRASNRKLVAPERAWLFGNTGGHRPNLAKIKSDDERLGNSPPD